MLTRRRVTMSRSYNKLWHILIDRNMTKTQLREAANITTNAMANLGKNESVPVETLEKICGVLNCTIDDIMDFDPDTVPIDNSGTVRGIAKRQQE